MASVAWLAWLLFVMAGIIAVERPSSWPVRHLRRHAAVTVANSKLEDMLHQCLGKLDSIEARIASLEGDSTPLGSLPPGIDVVRAGNGDMKKLDELDERLRRLTSLVFWIPGLKGIDEAVRKAIQHGINSGLSCPSPPESCSAKPEIEDTPDKPTEVPNFDIAQDDSKFEFDFEPNDEHDANSSTNADQSSNETFTAVCDTWEASPRDVKRIIYERFANTPATYGHAHEHKIEKGVERTESHGVHVTAAVATEAVNIAIAWASVADAISEADESHLSSDTTSNCRPWRWYHCWTHLENEKRSASIAKTRQ